MELTPQRVIEYWWMPGTCAYHLLGEGKDLPAWHPLISGDRQSVHEEGISVRGKVISEADIDMEDLEDYIVDWFD